MAPADRPSSCDDRDAVAWPAGPVAAARDRPSPRQRLMRRAPGGNGPGAAARFNRARLWRRPGQPGVPGRAAARRLPAPPSGGRPGRGPVAARRGGREHPHARRRPLLPPARQGPLCAGRRDEARHPALPPCVRLAHTASARPCQHRLRQRHPLSRKREDGKRRADGGRHWPRGTDRGGDRLQGRRARTARRHGGPGAGAAAHSGREPAGDRGSGLGPRRGPRAGPGIGERRGTPPLSHRSAP